jgi:hypothetical protein
MTNNTTNPTEIINNLDSTITNAPQGSTINLNFNTYENCYNTFNRESFVTDDVSNSEDTSPNISAEIEISDITPDSTSNISTPNNSTNVEQRSRTTSRTAVVPIPLNSSQEDISSRIQNVVNTIMNDTAIPNLQPIGAGISMTPILNTGVNNLRNENTDRGLTIAQLNNNTEVFLYESNNEEEKCAICDEIYKQNDICRKILKCGHTFHQGCIDTWLSEHSVCPICNQNIV